MGNSKKAITEELKDRVVTLNGKTTRSKIASELHISTRSIYRILLERGIVSQDKTGSWLSGKERSVTPEGCFNVDEKENWYI